MRHALLPSPLGELTLARDERGLVGLWYPDHRGGAPADLGVRDDAAFGDVAAQLGEYFAGERTAFDLPLAPRGDAFDQRVWAALRAIPHGAVRSYGELARDLGGPGHAQAVGAANGRNPLSVLVPCHRVVGADGTLTGYAGGLWRKRFLLSLEEPAPEAAGRLF
ncbi:methylated-DNA--[protein]-cysteine S-methyltransferase [Kineococcus sp. SYSU DK005]|uniref:methylated-DNA--[protein]-cysteine S-methyltransferase n=1 Tax=Kineococcus sp. SYSU DK005 TaxID=3383126 RepID=UPI003D7C959E